MALIYGSTCPKIKALSRAGRTSPTTSSTKPFCGKRFAIFAASISLMSRILSQVCTPIKYPNFPQTGEYERDQKKKNSALSCLTREHLAGTEEQVNALSDYHKAWWKRVQNRRNITLRCLNDFDCSGLQTTRLDGWNQMQPLYQNP